ncbi:MAG: glycosyltransferase family 4 protein [Planctomycetes bacterium]|nr:glycosyltransferase family 4 protein [Planctomycetota bacterium]
MKVALVIEKFTPAGGAERQCAYLARGLLARGHEVHVFGRHITDLPGLQRHLVPGEGIFRHQAFDIQSRKLLQAGTFDIIHSFTRTSYQDILRLGGGTHREYLDRTDPAYSALGRLWRKIRPKERLELDLERRSFLPQSSKKIVAVSHRVKEEVVRHYGVAAGKIAVIHNGVDANEFKPSDEARRLIRNQIGLEESDYTLLFVGSGFRRKGLESAIAAVDRVPSARLVVAGEGQAPSHPRVLMLGRRTDVSHLYAAADAFIFPTLYDPFPNAVLEAMSSGIPVIVSRVAGVSEIIDGDSIVVEEPRNIDELSAAVKKLEDPAVRKPMGEAARRKALAHPLDQVLDANLKIYDEVLALKGLRKAPGFEAPGPSRM